MILKLILCLISLRKCTSEAQYKLKRWGQVLHFYLILFSCLVQVPFNISGGGNQFKSFTGIQIYYNMILFI